MKPNLTTVVYNSVLKMISGNLNRIQHYTAVGQEKTSLDPKIKDCELLIIVPVYRRPQHLQATISYLAEEISRLEDPGSVGLIVSEMDDSPRYKALCEELGVSYIWKEKLFGVFNKSAAMNNAHKRFIEEFSAVPKYVLFHDVDIVADAGWVNDCLRNARRLQSSRGDSNGWVCQTIKDRKVHYVSEDLSKDFFAKKVSLRQLRSQKDEHKISDKWYEDIYPPGGSIMVNQVLLYTTGGYDPALFSGYSPEDKHFLDATQMICPNSLFAFESDCFSYHLYHPHLELSNGTLDHMVTISEIILSDIFLFTTYLVSKISTGSTFPVEYNRKDKNEENKYPVCHSEMHPLFNNRFAKMSNEELALLGSFNNPTARLILTYRQALENLGIVSKQ